MMKMILSIMLVLLANTVNASTSEFKTEVVATGLGIPWGMSFIDNTQVLVTDRMGDLYLVNSENGVKTGITGLPPIHAKGQGGLLDIAYHHDSKRVYLTYTKPSKGEGVTVLASASLKLKENRLTEWKDLVVTVSDSDTNRHYGSRIAFDGEGHVFFTVGDRGVRPNGQNRQTHAGSVLRVNLDGSVPKDNPFVHEAKVLPEIWSYGHRNPQGLFFDRSKKTLWLIEHGPRGGDEINLIVKGKNYGWPVVSHGKEYWGPLAVGEGTEKAGMEPAIKVYTPSIAPSGLVMYSGKMYQAWKGDLVSGALKLRHLNRVTLNANDKVVDEFRYLEKAQQRIRNVIEGPDGLLYFSTDSGRLVRILSVPH